MVKKVIEASEAIAQGVKLCRPDVIPMYPITPQTHIVERLSEYINDGILDCEMLHAESEHSAISAAIGAQAAGVRTFTATASQGLALMSEILYIASGMRLPIVMAIANRALSAPINIWNDHSDTFSVRDSSWMQFYAESAQEALDTTIQAFKIAENEKVLLPAMVCIDGFTLSHVYEPVDIPSQKEVDKFIKKYSPKHAFLDPKKPMTQGPIGFPDSYMDLKKDQQDAMIIAKKVIKEVNKEFKKNFGRSYGDGLIEKYRTDDAERCIIAMGSVCGTIRTVVDELRKKGQKVGMIKLKSFRPFPDKELFDACSKLKAVGVVEKAISFGNEGPLFAELRSVLYGQKTIVNDYIAGLGGRDVTPTHIRKVFSSLNKENKTDWLF